MKKVLCIDVSLNKCYNTGRIVPIPEYLKTYTVLEEIDKRYILEEMPHNVGYEMHIFIPLSDIDEMGLVNKIELVNS